MCTSKPTRQRGLSLVELVLFIVIVSVAVVAIVGAMSLNTKHSADPLRRKQALMIAEAYLEEVELAQFSYCEPTAANSDSAKNTSECAGGAYEKYGAEPGEGRPFDNVNDYNGASFADASGNLLDVNGEALGVAGYAASVSVVPADLGDIAGGANEDPNVLRITVTVTYDGNQSVSLDGFRTRYAPQVQ